MVPLYVINLKRRPDQYNNFINNNKKLPIDIIRFEAIDGKEMNDALSKIKKTPIHKQSKHGRFGCFLSHLGVLQLITENHGLNEWVIIAEDDAIIDPELFTLWDNIIEQTEIYNIDVLFLSRSYTKKDKLVYPLVNGPNIVQVYDELYGMHLYMVKGSGAKKILNMKEMDAYGNIPCDVAIGIGAKKENIHALIKYDKLDPDPIATDKILPMYNKTIMAYAKLSGTMSSSTEEYFHNIKEHFTNNKPIGISLIVLFIIGIASCVLYIYTNHITDV